MTTQSESTVNLAKQRLEAAQAEYEAALKELSVDEQFPVKDDLYAVVLATPEFHQFVGFKDDAVEIIAVFQNRERANKFAEKRKAPSGRMFFVMPVELRS